VEETDVTFADIGGLDEVKAELRAALEHPLRFPEFFSDCGLDADGVLLYGAPGNGKTMLAKALANEYDRTFITVNGPELQDKYVGSTEKHIRQVFATARERAPSVVFFDEFDALAGTRDDVSSSHKVDFVTMLLAELDGFRETNDVLVIAATNRPDALDPGVLRPGRLGRRIHVPLPDDEAARAIVTTHTTDFPLDDDVTPQWIVDELPEGLSAAAITEVCNQALRWHAMRRAATSNQTPTVTREDIRAAVSDYPLSTEDRTDSGVSGFY
jgi:transitional endoplasmic reticulum ATPase